MKACIKCTKELPLTEFYKDAQKKDGKQLWCKSCERIRHAASRAKYAAAFRAKHRRYYIAHKEHIKMKRHEWYEINAYKRRAHERVKDALYAGTLSRPDKCEHCRDGGRLVAHHSDYDKPLDVVWLCPSCHQHAHR